MAENIKKNSKVSRDRQTVVLEDINSKFDLMLEQFSGLNNKIDNNHQEFLEFKGEMVEFRGEMIGFRGEMTDFKSEMIDFKKQTNENFKELFKFRKETGENFSAVMEYLTRIDDEIQDMKAELKNLKEALKEKADLDRLAGFEKRLIKVEKILLARMA